ncbi:MAG: hypothetical protein HQL28_04725 [Candidatus Omnitrophica bacterium]|nr:hypothetical protein [Candidatus Omnitrophota bacterium]
MKNIYDKKGFALASIMIIISLIAFFYMTLLVISQNDLIMSNRRCNSMRAHYLADAGIADGYAHLRDSAGNYSFAALSYPVGEGKDTGKYNVTVALKTSGTWPIYTITSKGTYGGVSRTLRLTVQLTSFSHWAYITNTEICYYPGWEGYASYWVTGNIVNGPLQVNDNLYIAGNPIFNGAVSVVSDHVTYYDAPGVDKPLFNEGLWVGVPTVPLPDPAPLLSSICDMSKQSGGMYLDGVDRSDPNNPKPGLHSTHNAVAIEFFSNGTMNLTQNGTTSNMPLPSNGAIYVSGGEVEVKGVLNGQVTIGCDQNIYTTDSIIYHDTSPGTPNPASTDVLGLVAKTNVVFPNNLPRGDKEIDAYIVALNGSFYLENMGSLAYGDVRGNLVQYGGVMAQWSATVFGCFDGPGNLLYGYLQIPYYDDRLNTLIPPGFTPARDYIGPKYRRVFLEEL